MKVFLTGATGVIGRRAIPLLISAGHAVTAVARSPEKASALARSGASPVQADLFDPAAVRAAVAGQEAVINLATHIPPSSRVMLPGAWRENDRIRGEASGILAEAARAAGAGRFIQESFAPIYPDRGDAWITEETPVRPVRYNRTAVKAEESAARFGQGGGAGVVLRFALFYGPDSEFTQALIRSARKGWALGFGRPEAYISSVSHDDAAAAVLAALSVPGGVYNVVDDEPLPRRAFYDSLAEALGVPPPRLLPAWLKVLAGSLGEMMARSLRISNRKLRQASGWAPQYPSVREGWRSIV
ncbi:MAG: NAD-dependent epimerase/dehydratase family protein [Thermoanaerobaculia bacterium]